MRQAIVTRYLGPTDTRGSRVKAIADAGSLMVSWRDELDSNENHTRAALALAVKLRWAGRWVGGGMRQNTGGNCYVNVPDAPGPDDGQRDDEFTLTRGGLIAEDEQARVQP